MFYEPMDGKPWKNQASLSPNNTTSSHTEVLYKRFNCVYISSVITKLLRKLQGVHANLHNYVLITKEAFKITLKLKRNCQKSKTQISFVVLHHKLNLQFRAQCDLHH